MGKLLDPIIGRVLTLLGYDGTDFHVPRTTTGGVLEASVVDSALPGGAATEQTLNSIYDILRLGNRQLRTDRIGETKQITGSSGTITWDFTAVPSDELWIIEHSMLILDQGSSTFIQMLARNASLSIALIRQGAPSLYVGYGSTNPLTLSPSDNIRIIADGVGANTKLTGVYWGYKVKLTD